MSGNNDRPTTWFQRFTGWVLALFVHGLFAILAIMGALVINAMIQAWRTGEAGTGEAFGLGFFGLVMLVIGVGFFYVAYVGAPRFLGGLERKRKKHGDRPWLANRQWRARRVVHSTKFTAWFMWFWCVCWWGIVGLIWSVNKDLIVADLRGPWQQAIPSAIPFVAGIIGLLVAISVTWRRYRFGDTVLLIDTLPGFLGERFRGKVQARLKGPLNEPATLTLLCGSLRKHRTRNSNGGYRTEWITDPLWSRNHTLQPTQTTFDRGMVTLPVDIALPSDQPESGHILDEPQIVWTLKVRPGTVLDRSLTGEFQVPIFARRDPG